MTIGAVIFDLDGTLIDSLEDLGTSVNRMLEKNGFPTHKIENYRNYIGDGALKLVSRALPSNCRNAQTLEKYLAAFKSEYNQNWNNKTKPYSGISGLLDKLSALNLKLAVLSNKPHSTTNLCVKSILGGWSFDKIQGQQDPLPPKPNPTGAKQIASYLQVQPADFLFLGDTAIDMQTAVRAGMYPVGVLWGFRGREELIKGGARTCIEHPLDLLKLFPKT